MPRRGREITSRFGQVQKQAQQLLTNLRKEIRSKEDELRRLKEEDAKLSGFAGVSANGGRGAATSRATASTGARVNWSTVLEQLPSQFKAADLRKLREIADKRSSEIFAAITRWIEAKSVRRKERGVYERVEQSQARKSKKTA
jgi:hypothetical protein